MNHLLTKFICLLKIHLKQNINSSWINVKLQVWIILIILRLLWILKWYEWCLIQNDEYNIQSKKKLIHIIADTVSNTKLIVVVIKLFIRFSKIIIALVFITQPHFKLPKCTRLNCKHYFIVISTGRWDPI